jgi:hypothetical protein
MRLGFAAEASQDMLSSLAQQNEALTCTHGCGRFLVSISANTGLLYVRQKGWGIDSGSPVCKLLAETPVEVRR